MAINNILNGESAANVRDKLNQAIQSVNIHNSAGYATVQYITNLIANYYLKSETYNKTEINSLVSSVNKLEPKLIASINDVTEEGYIYLLPVDGVDSNFYNEYLLINGVPELIGSFGSDIDLSNYITLGQLTNALSAYVTSTAFNTAISNLANTYVAKEAGKSLIEDSKIAKLDSLPDDLEINAIINTEEEGFYIVDTLGNIVIKYDKGGLDAVKINKNLIKQYVNPLSSELAEINHIISYGQSLAAGDGSLPILTSTAKYDNIVMFNQGINSIDNTTPEIDKYTSLVALTEVQIGTCGESPTGGLAEYFVFKGDISDKYKILCSNCSKGATTIAQLSKGTTYYNRIITDVTKAYELSLSLGKTYKLLAITWTQGEYDLISNTEKEDYKNALIQLRTDLINDLEAIIHQNLSELPIIMYQMTSSGSAGVNKNIALAHYDLSMENDYFYLSTPIYMLKFKDGTGGWHIENYSSKLLGCYYGRTLFDSLVKRIKNHIHPINISIDGYNLYVKFYVPNGKLVLDNPPNIDTLGTVTNYGFSVLKTNGNESIQSVELYTDDTIKITCDIVDFNGKSLDYGNALTNEYRGQFAGCLRDSSVDRVIINNTEYNLFNWCPVFTYNI